MCAEDDYLALYRLTCLIQANLAIKGIFVRGGLCYDGIYYDPSGDFIYGKGIIKAYELENEKAKFPRIILDDSFTTAVAGGKNAPVKDILTELDWYGREICDYICVDYLSYMKKYYDAFKVNPLYYSNISFDEILKEHKERIEEKLNLFPKQQEKYTWCKKYHNNFCEKYTEYVGYKI